MGKTKSAGPPQQSTEIMHTKTDKLYFLNDAEKH